MQLVRTVETWRRLRASARLAEPSIGFVPTLGGLHAGHEALLRRSLEETDVTVLSIFLNPTQFEEAADLESYPADLDADLRRAEELGVDLVFRPTPSEIYPGGYRYRVSETDLGGILEGAHRPGHFDGVLTVVLKLLLLVRPRRAYFGEKDHQQLELVRGMATDFFLDCAIVACPTVRAADGLALSSRNERLDPPSRRRAPEFPALLRSPMAAPEVASRLAARGFVVDYVVDRGTRRYGAVRLGGVRLIDNVDLEHGLERGA
jgi:pantoate--beta-alanine ligase